MTPEMKEKILQAIQIKGLKLQNISAEAGINYSAFYRYFQGDSNSIRLYTFMDILDSVGLELSINGAPVTSHQDLIDLAKSKPLPKKISSVSSLYRFIRGENVNTDTAYKILVAQGLEPRII